MSYRGAAWLAWLVCALTLGLIASSVALAFLNHDILSSVYLIAVALCALVGEVIATRRSANPVGWIILAVGAIFAFQELSLQYATYGLVTGSFSLPLARTMAWFTSWMYVPGLFLLLSFPPLYFPDGRLVSPRWRWIARSALVFGVVMAVIEALVPGRIRNLDFVNPMGVEGLRPVLLWLSDVTYLAFFGIIFASATSLVVRFRRVWGEQRQQIKWLAYGVSALPAWFLINPFIGVVVSPFLFDLVVTVGDALLFAGIPVALGVAVLRYRLYDIDLLINRTLVYGSLTATLVALYFGGIVLLQRVLVAFTGEKSTLAVVASTLAIAALFNPLRRRIQGFIDRRFYRRKYDAAKTLEAFSAKLRDETDLDTLSEDLTGVARETLQPAHVSLWLRQVEHHKGADGEALRKVRT